jgi:hypothetical protein
MKLIAILLLVATAAVGAEIRSGTENKQADKSALPAWYATASESAHLGIDLGVGTFLHEKCNTNGFRNCFDVQSLDTQAEIKQLRQQSGEWLIAGYVDIADRKTTPPFYRLEIEPYYTANYTRVSNRLPAIGPMSHTMSYTAAGGAIEILGVQRIKATGTLGNVERWYFRGTLEAPETPRLPACDETGFSGDECVETKDARIMFVGLRWSGRVAYENGQPGIATVTRYIEDNPADVNIDGRVNGLDIAAVKAPGVWMKETREASRADVNGDGQVNGLDVAAVRAAMPK